VTRWETKRLGERECEALGTEMILAIGGALIEIRDTALRFTLRGEFYELLSCFGTFRKLTPKEEK